MRRAIQVIMIVVVAGGTFFNISCQKQNAAQPASEPNPAGKIEQISVERTRKAVENGGVQFIDVRTKEEFAEVRAFGATNYPLADLEVLLASLDKKKPVYIICATGRRSQKGAEILEKNGFEEIYNISGGTTAWISAGLPTQK